MAVFCFECPKCGQADRMLLPRLSDEKKCRRTPGCDGTLKRTPRPPSVVQKEVIDNSIMPRRIERDIDIEKLVHERAHKDYRRRD